MKPELIYPREHKSWRLGSILYRDILEYLVDEGDAGTTVEPYNFNPLVGLRNDVEHWQREVDKLYATGANNSAVFKAINIDIALWETLVKILKAQYMTKHGIKFYEVVSHHQLLIPPLIPPQNNDRKFLAFFNAELPGSALCSFNHIIKTKPGFVTEHYDWRASSVDPVYLTSIGEEVGASSYTTYWKSNRDRWLINEENNGDCRLESTIRYLQMHVGPESSFKGVDLYHHDAASEDVYIDQESKDARLHLGSALAGFLTLRKGGSFLAAQNSFFQTFTWNLILIYASLFEEFHISKLIFSRSNKSEIYLVGKGFKGLPKKLEKVLMARLNSFNMEPLLGREVMEDPKFGPIIKQLQEIAEHIHGEQIAALKRILEIYENFKDNTQELARLMKPVAEERAEQWLKRYPVKKIEKKDRIQWNYHGDFDQAQRYMRALNGGQM